MQITLTLGASVEARSDLIGQFGGLGAIFVARQTIGQYRKFFRGHRFDDEFDFKPHGLGGACALKLRIRGGSCGHISILDQN